MALSPQIVGPLGLLAVNLSHWLRVGYLVMIALVWWRGTKVVLTRRQWPFVALLVASVIIEVSLSQYLIWTGVGAEVMRARGGKFTLIAQHVDALHEDAGSHSPVMVDGTIARWRCSRHSCQHGAPWGSLPLDERTRQRPVRE